MTSSSTIPTPIPTPFPSSTYQTGPGTYLPQYSYNSSSNSGLSNNTTVLLHKGPWTPEEDALVKTLVATHGPKKWSLISLSLPGRVGKQCRERWHNHLNPKILRGEWTLEEDKMIINYCCTKGNKWAEISK